MNFYFDKMMNEDAKSFFPPNISTDKVEFWGKKGNTSQTDLVTSVCLTK